jgi:hypothetical protein
MYDKPSLAPRATVLGSSRYRADVGVPRGDGPLTSSAAFWFHVARDVVRRPRLWTTAARQLRRMTPRTWWRRRPFLPVPDAAYVRFRIDTAYGPHGTPSAPDVITYLEWCRAQEHTRNTA